ncbi:hypothetical protein LCGC14_3063480 [marine sediment metagenome]|uniref:DUF4177 domain-containing protein n=1 Tax=marine sediment metagenome TaxID=412755 RepID=A0A0F8WI51_9ZZZZ
MKKFEYKIIAGSEMLNPEEDEFLLNELGNERWELVATELMKTRGDGIGTKRQVYWLKREIKS